MEKLAENLFFILLIPFCFSKRSLFCHSFSLLIFPIRFLWKTVDFSCFFLLYFSFPCGKKRENFSKNFFCFLFGTLPKFFFSQTRFSLIFPPFFTGFSHTFPNEKSEKTHSFQPYFTFEFFRTFYGYYDSIIYYFSLFFSLRSNQKTKRAFH